MESGSFEKFFRQFTERFTPELTEHFATLSPDPEFQARLDELGIKANDGTLNDEEAAASMPLTSRQWTLWPRFASKPSLFLRRGGQARDRRWKGTRHGELKTCRSPKLRATVCLVL